MPRQVRIEFAGAMYHVMARGNRRGDIYFGDGDRRSFLGSLGQASERSGFRVHAYVLMSNHYHLLLETPEANLAAGLGWLQNAYTRRINTQHGLWGHLFGGRYKAILVEPGESFRAVMDYIHLNPVRAGLVPAGSSLTAYPWSSLPDYVGRPGRRPDFLTTSLGLAVGGCRDETRGRRRFLAMLEAQVDWSDPQQAGTPSGTQRTPERRASGESIRRGWFFGSPAFGKKLLALAGRKLKDRRKRRADGYHGPDIADHSQEQARRLIECGLGHLSLGRDELSGLAKSDWRKALIGEVVQATTLAKLDWISSELHMGTRSGTCRAIQEMKKRLPNERTLRKLRDDILRTGKFYD